MMVPVFLVAKFLRLFYTQFAMKEKIVNYRIFLSTFIILFVAISALGWILNQYLHEPMELQCRENMKILQKAVNTYNRLNPDKKLTSMEFSFPDLVESKLIPDNYLTQSIPELKEKHSYHLQRNGFVNCRLHPRNPFVLYLMGLIILTVLFSIIILGLLRYRIG